MQLLLPSANLQRPLAAPCAARSRLGRWLSDWVIEIERRDPVTFGSTYPDRDLCITLRAQDCATSLEVAPDTDVAQLDSCASQLADLSCADWLANVDPPSCQRRGDREEGQECTEHQQCASGYCDGSCTDPGAEGEPCASFGVVGAPCQEGLLCGFVADGEDAFQALCQPPLEPGDACDHPTSACPFPTACVEGTCVEPEPGTTCTFTTACGASWSIGTCDTGNCANCADGVCAEFELVGLDDICGSHRRCDATTYCSLGHLSATGICLARPDVGQSCEPSANVAPPVCVAGAECVGNVCVSSL